MSNRHNGFSVGGVFESVFSPERKNSVTESAFDSFDPIPWRLTNRNVLADWFSDSVQIMPAVREGMSIPAFGDELTYPFVGITGYSMGGGKYAKSGSESDFQKRSKGKQPDVVREDIDAAIRRSDSAIKPGSYIFLPDKVISSSTYRITGGTRRETNMYRKISENDFILDQQVLSLDADGGLFVDKAKDSGVVMKKMQGEICVLKRLDECVYQFAKKFNIADSNTVIEFFNDNIRRFVNSNGEYGGAYGNPTYFRFAEFFRSRGCEGEDGRIDAEKAKDAVAEMMPIDFIVEFVWKYWLRSDVNDTYVWVKGHEGRNYSKKDFDVFNAILSGVKVYSKNADSDKGFDKDAEKAEDEKTDSVDAKGDSDSSDGDAETVNEDVADEFGYDMKDIFFSTMVNVLEKPNHREVVESFREGKRRTFIRVDPVGGNSVLDFKPFFKDPQFSEILDNSKPKEFIHREISGAIVSFPVDFDIEDKIKQDSKDNAGKKDDIKWSAVLKEYLDAVKSENAKSRGGFHISMLMPMKGKVDKSNCFFCTGYESSPTQNDIDRDGKYKMTASIAQAIERVKPTVATRLGSVLWYNARTDNDDSKQHMASRGKSIKSDDAGRKITAV